ncbi:c-type cytochrome [Microvirga pudoricolor]|uniref:c-type cytochrome n=1 Tax=Microvirga pudoricolor TaxID=2778729 RepID=UPI002D21DE28|nr:cytochrome c [Microvirga pudoricolor]
MTPNIIGKPRQVVLLAAAVALGGAAVLGYRSIAPTRPEDSAQIALGHNLYGQHCASCHGANLEGQPNWQEPLPNGRLPAPPHDASGHTWHHSDDELFTLTRDGLAAVVPGHESDMPAFAGVLSDEEIRAVLAFIKSTWPEKEREYQAARTEARKQ